MVVAECLPSPHPSKYIFKKKGGGGVTRTDIEMELWCHDILGISCTYGLHTMGWTSGDRKSIEDGKQKDQINRESVLLGSLVLEDKAEVSIIEMYKIMKSYDKVKGEL